MSGEYIDSDNDSNNINDIDDNDIYGDMNNVNNWNDNARMIVIIKMMTMTKVTMMI